MLPFGCLRSFMLDCVFHFEWRSSTLCKCSGCMCMWMCVCVGTFARPVRWMIARTNMLMHTKGKVIKILSRPYASLVSLFRKAGTFTACHMQQHMRMNLNFERNPTFNKRPPNQFACNSFSGQRIRIRWRSPFMKLLSFRFYSAFLFLLFRHRHRRLFFFTQLFLMLLLKLFCSVTRALFRISR